MAGHSKWANIKHRKAAVDAKRGKIFTRLIKEITVASRLGGSDVGANPRLRLAVDKALDANMPKDTIERAVKKGSGELEGVNYEEARYEGYGVGGAAVLVDCLTDNIKRTVAEVRHAFSKHGGNLGTDGSVAFLFKHCTQVIFSPETDEEAVMEAGLSGDAEDVIVNDDGSIEVVAAPSQLDPLNQAFKEANLVPELSEVTYKAMTENFLQGNEAEQMQKLVDALESLDDVQDVYTTAAYDG